MHRHRIDKYPDIFLANQTARKALPATVAKSCNRKMAALPELLLAYPVFLSDQSQRSSFTVIGYAETGRQRSPMMCRLL